ncbi:MAG: outer membrane protein assembly factor BamD [Pseudomonadota bacterium]|nr:outer membrane protein assembly factor BamD [Pseudomonadota bacterium]
MKKLLILPLVLVVALSGCAPSSSGIEAFKDKSAQDIYATGEKAMKSRSYKVAIQNFEALDALYPFSAFAENSQLHLIYAYHGSNDTASAITAADRYIHLYPRSERVDYAYYMKGYMRMQQDKSWVYNTLPMDPSSRDLASMQEAFQDFSTLIRYFPRSEYALDARKRMIFIRDLLAKHELDVAKFYYKHKAYVAAANRASDIVQHYQGSSQVRPALQLMADSYHSMGKTDLEEETLAVLKHNQRRPVKG